MNMTIATPSDLTAVEKTLQQYGQYAKKWVVTRSFGHAFSLEIEFTERADEALAFFNRQPL